MSTWLTFRNCCEQQHLCCTFNDTTSLGWQEMVLLLHLYAGPPSKELRNECPESHPVCDLAE